VIKIYIHINTINVQEDYATGINVSVLLAVEGHDVLLVSSYEQRGTVDAVAQRFHPGHIERTGTVDVRDWKRTETHTHN